jgi:hypothetical protein
MPQQKCDGCEALEARVAITEADILHINGKVDPVIHSHASMREAFPENDLNKPDYDGHRREHKRRATDIQVVNGYKESAVKEVIKWALIGTLMMTLSGAMQWIKDHLK